MPNEDFMISFSDTKLNPYVLEQILKEMGYEVIGATMKLCSNEDMSVEDAKKVCEKLQIEHVELDCTEQFKRHVIDDFINCYSLIILHYRVGFFIVRYVIINKSLSNSQKAFNTLSLTSRIDSLSFPSYMIFIKINIKKS